MSAKLIAEEGVLAGLILSFDEGDEWILGRNPADCQMVVADPAASEQQLKASRTEEGGIQIENLSDSHPVQVNDEQLTVPRVLHHGDAVKIGNSRFRFYTEIGPEIQGLNGQEGTHEEDMKPVAPESIETKEEEETTEVPTQEEDPLLSQEASEDNDLLARVDFGLEEAGPFMLKVIRGPNGGAEFSMETGRSYVIGTAPTVCDVVFHDISVSRQHAKVTITPDNKLFIEDMGSRNGVLIDEKKITERTALGQNTVVTLGTTSFIVFDRENERQTVITPLLPSIVKSLQKEEVKKEKKKTIRPVAPPPVPQPLVKELPPPTPKTNYLTRALLGLGIFALVMIFGLATSTLFRSQAVVAPEVNYNQEIDAVISKYPSLQYSFSKDNGRLLLIGHVLTTVDRSQLSYQLQALPFIKSIDEKSLIVDEYVWRETNQILSKNPQWMGISLNSPTPGKFTLSGYLKTRKQADQLNDFLAQNFRYLDRLDNKVIVEESEFNAINALIQEKGFRDVNLELHNGEVTLTGTMPATQAPELDKVIEQIKKRPTIRIVKDYVTQLETEQAIVDLTDSYTVAGSSNVGGITVSVVINGRILTKGDFLDGMTITDIRKNTILLERDGVKYKIEYNK